MWTVTSTISLMHPRLACFTLSCETATGRVRPCTSAKWGAVFHALARGWSAVLTQCAPFVAFPVVRWNDIEYKAGPTYFAPDSIPHVLCHLRDNPTGLSAFALRTSHNVKAKCRLSVPCTGRAGDVFLAHPQMLHTSSQNVKRIPRFMRNGQVRLSAPMWTAATLSPVERCSLRCLGEDWSSGTTRAPTGFRAPPDELRGACDHDDGQLLGWAYGARPSYRGGMGPGSAVSLLESSTASRQSIVQRDRSTRRKEDSSYLCKILTPSLRVDACRRSADGRPSVSVNS